ncbi:MAG: hypothetical protein KME49_05090 [Brasilonema octagenarum HA4186-MV1]|nr:hypothetical protein [Brasilonema octagenarum HA4186-MV1]
MSVYVSLLFAQQVRTSSPTAPVISVLLLQWTIHSVVDIRENIVHKFNLFQPTATAEDLLHKKILEGAQLRERLNQAKAPAELAQWLRTDKISEDKPLMQSLLV